MEETDRVVKLSELIAGIDNYTERVKPKRHSIIWNILDERTVKTYKPLTSNALLIRMLEPIRTSKYDTTIDNPDLYRNISEIRCDDISEIRNKDTTIFNQEHAMLIKKILKNNYDEIVVHCSLGISRSSGIMLAIAKYIKDVNMIAYIESRDFYIPNRHIEQTLYKVLRSDV